MAGKRKQKAGRDGGARIIQGLNDALAWARGETTAMVHLPGQPGRLMTRAEYEAARASTPAPSQQRGEEQR